jgi:hypothetical protein
MEREFHLQLQKSPPFISNLGQMNPIRSQNSNIHLNISLPYMYRIPKRSLPQILKYLFSFFRKLQDEQKFGGVKLNGWLL